jgi:hypothetical protein
LTRAWLRYGSGRVAALTVTLPLGVGALSLWFGPPLVRRIRGDPPLPE